MLDFFDVSTEEVFWSTFFSLQTKLIEKQK